MGGEEGEVVVDGGVFPEDVVADGRARHGVEHGRGGLGDGVAAEVDGEGGGGQGGRSRLGVIGGRALDRCPPAALTVTPYATPCPLLLQRVACR